MAVRRWWWLLVFVWPALASADDASVAARLEQVLAGLSSVRAEFSQELHPADGGAVEHAKGTFYLRRPGRFRWDYIDPKQTIVCDGERLWLYDPDLEQVTVKRVREALAATPAMLLSGQTRIADHYRVRDGGTFGGLTIAVLTPKASASDFREIRLGLVGNDLRSLEFVDRLNARTRIELSHVERNAALKDGLFVFQPPAGVDVIGARP
jgi:outer membrane lipoprotein carrier protein